LYLPCYFEKNEDHYYGRGYSEHRRNNGAELNEDDEKGFRRFNSNDNCSQT